jgi:hypothetical protein
LGVGAINKGVGDIVCAVLAVNAGLIVGMFYITEGRE